MKKINKLQLTKTSYLLVIAASISLFLLVVFFSYSLYGERGTYSKEIVPGSACASYGFSCYKCTDPYTLDSNFKWYTAYEADTSQCNPTNPGDCANSTCAVDCDGVIDNDGIFLAEEITKLKIRQQTSDWRRMRRARLKSLAPMAWAT